MMSEKYGVTWQPVILGNHIPKYDTTTFNWYNFRIGDWVYDDDGREDCLVVDCISDGKTASVLLLPYKYFIIANNARSRT